MKVDIPVDPDKISRKKADNRGRVNLGNEYAGKRVLITVLEEEDPTDVDMDEAGPAAAEAEAIIERADDPLEVLEKLQSGESEEAYEMMGMSPEEAAAKASEWRDRLVGDRVDEGNE
ncbi:MAG: hypothetical protein IH933_16410 [Euryarchaeota archaeon]|jgi:hypothetical protein|nr:hypothetical protein [Euryarchaeota archaeon]